MAQVDAPMVKRGSEHSSHRKLILNSATNLTHSCMNLESGVSFMEYRLYLFSSLTIWVRDSWVTD